MSKSRAWDVVTFDCYGTLIDWERGIGDAFDKAASAAGIRLSREKALVEYSRYEPMVEAGAYISYATVLAESAVLTAASMGWKLDSRGGAFLPQSLPSWPPFGDTNPALTKMKQAGLQLGILSNVDDNLLAETLKHFDVQFDFTITAQQVKSYKPGHAHFKVARERIGQQKWLHCAQSYFHDVVPAVALSIPVAWINRKHEAPTGSARPDLEFHNLNELATHLTRHHEETSPWK